jgi:hypothetical protein
MKQLLIKTEILKQGSSRVARFFFVQHTKTGKYTKLPLNISNYRKIDQKANVHLKTLKNLPKLGL